MTSGYMYISTNTGCAGSPYTNLDNFKKLIESWKKMGAKIIVKSKNSVEARFKDGKIRWAHFN